MTECWKCGGNSCEECRMPQSVAKQAQEKIKKALERCNKMGEHIEDIKAKIKSHQAKNHPVDYTLVEDRDISRIIHFLCLMIDDLEEMVISKKPIRACDKLELIEKLDTLKDFVAKLA